MKTRSALLLGLLLGCACPAPVEPDAGPGATLAFAALPATVDCATTADADLARAGFQIKARIQLVDGAGDGFTKVAVTNASDASDDSAPSEANFDNDGRVAVIVTVAVEQASPGADNVLTATASDANGNVITASESLHVICANLSSPPECRFTNVSAGDVLTVSPLPLSVRCLGGDLGSVDEQGLLASGTVVVTATPRNGQPPQSIELDLVGGSGGGDLQLPVATAATIDLVLADPAGVFNDPVVAAIDVVIELVINDFAATSIVAVAAGADGVLNIADNGNLETSDSVTTDVTVAFDAPATGGITGSTAIGTCAGTAQGSAVTLIGCSFPQGPSNIVLSAPSLSTIGATTTINVDTVSPTALFTVPSNDDVLSSANDTNALLAGLQTTITLASIDDGASVTLLDGATVAGNATVQDGVAIVNATIAQGTRTLTASLVDTAGNAGSAGSITLTVDSEAPVLVLTAQSSISGSDDLDAVAAGIQVEVTLTTTGLTSGRTIAIASDVDGVIDDGACAGAGDDVFVVCRISILTSQAHVVTASATDEVGNSGGSAAVAIAATP